MAAHPGASVQVDGAAAPATLPLTVGLNTILITVTAEDGTTSGEHTLVVRRRTSDLRLPTLTLTTPVVGASIVKTGSLVGDLAVKGIVDDDVEVAGLTLSINGGAARTVTLATTTPKRKTFQETLSGALDQVGDNTLEFKATDSNGNVTTLTRVVKLVVRGALTLDVQGSNAPGLVTGLAAGPVYEVGKSYKLTAAQYDSRPVTDASARFASWSGAGISGTAQVLTFTMSPALITSPVITVSYVTNPFVGGTAGRYDGLIRPLPGGPVNSASHGHLSLDVTASGTFTGSVHLDGFKLPFSGGFNGGGSLTMEVARGHLGLPPLALDLAMDLTGATGLVQGTATSGARVCQVVCRRGHYNAANPVPAGLLNGHYNNRPNQRGYHTVILPHISQPGMADSQHPMGTAFGSLMFSRLGVVTTILRLQDQAVGTSAYMSVIDKDGVIPLFTPLYASRVTDSRGRPAARFDGSLSGLVTLDDSLAGSDLSGLGHLWFRPALPSAAHYPAGWPAGITRNFFGARYNSPAGVPLFASVAPQNPATGNLELRLEEGLLALPFIRALNLNPLSAGLTKAPLRPKDNSYLMGIYKPTGSITGYFGHNLGKTSLFGVIYQKGPAAGGHGFFMSPRPPVAGGTSQSGSATVELK